MSSAGNDRVWKLDEERVASLSAKIGALLQDTSPTPSTPSRAASSQSPVLFDTLQKTDEILSPQRPRSRTRVSTESSGKQGSEGTSPLVETSPSASALSLSREESELRRRHEKLRQDFLYNLRLLEERDKELQKYDAMFQRFRSVVEERDAEVARLREQARKEREEFAQRREDFQTEQQRLQQRERTLQEHARAQASAIQEVASEFSELQKQHREKVSHFQDTVRNLQEKLKIAESRIDEDRYTYEKKLREMSENTQRQLRQVSEESERNVQKLRHAQDTVRLLQDEIRKVSTAAQKENSTLQRELLSADTRFGEEKRALQNEQIVLQERLGKVTREFAEFRERSEASLRESQSECTGFRSSWQQAQSELSALRQHAETLQQRHAQTVQRNAALQEENEMLRSQQRRAQQEVAGLQDENEQLQRRYEAAQRETEALRRDHEALLQVAHELRRRQRRLREVVDVSASDDKAVSPSAVLRHQLSRDRADGYDDRSGHRNDRSGHRSDRSGHHSDEIWHTPPRASARTLSSSSSKLDKRRTSTPEGARTAPPARTESGTQHLASARTRARAHLSDVRGRLNLDDHDDEVAVVGTSTGTSASNGGTGASSRETASQRAAFEKLTRARRRLEQLSSLKSRSASRSMPRNYARFDDE